MSWTIAGRSSSVVFTLGVVSSLWTGCIVPSPSEPDDIAGSSEPQTKPETEPATAEASVPAVVPGRPGTLPELPPVDPRLLAPGVRIASVTADQAIQVELVAGGRAVGPEHRNAVLVAHRVLRIVAHVEVGADRDVVGRLWLVAPGGSVVELDAVATPAGESTLAFAWTVDAAAVRAGSRYRLAIYRDGEVGAGSGALSPPQTGALHPAHGTDDLGIAPAPAPLRVVVVPYRNVVGACDRAPAIDPQTIAGFRDRLLMLYPVSTVDIAVHETVRWEGSFGSLGDVLEDLQRRRSDEDAPSRTFYYGLLDPCDAVTGGSGLGWIPPDPVHAGGGWLRVAAGLSLADDPVEAAETMAHEIAHNLGRKHVACDGHEADPDLAYPYPDGRTAHPGTGIVDGSLRDAGQPDLMSYCDGEAWISDYTWNGLYEVLVRLR